MTVRKIFPLAVLCATVVLAFVLTRNGGAPARAADGPAAAAPANADDIAALKAEVTRLKGMVPDQSHAMSDVGYHFSNLWFAAQNGNWPLAQFYSDETRSHLRWAVRIIPLRKDREGRQVDLKAILDALEQTSLKDLDQAVKSKDKTKFATAYKQQMENCMACHRASSKEYICLHIPERPDASMVEFPPAGPADGAKP
jgi:hypothetical protein